MRFLSFVTLLVCLISITGCADGRWDDYKQARIAGNYQEAVDILSTIIKDDYYATGPDGREATDHRIECIGKMGEEAARRTRVRFRGTDLAH